MKCKQAASYKCLIWSPSIFYINNTLKSMYNETWGLLEVRVIAIVVPAGSIWLFAASSLFSRPFTLMTLLRPSKGVNKFKGLGTRTALLKEFSDAPTAPPDPFLRIPSGGGHSGSRADSLLWMFVWGRGAQQQGLSLQTPEPLTDWLQNCSWSGKKGCPTYQK